MKNNAKSKHRTTHRRSAVSRRGPTVRDFADVMDEIAPTALAQEWDNVGLLTGDPGAALRRVLLCIDLTHEVADEAIRGEFDLILAYHPPLFRPIHRIRLDSIETDAILHRCVRGGIGVYATHTALDAADGGTNDVIAGLCGVRETKPLVFADQPGEPSCKLVTFVPSNQVDQVASVLFEAGAGRIGDYTCCSFRVSGLGTFQGNEASNPTLGRRGRLEHVDELRLETVVSKRQLPEVIEALKRTHPYEEPAFDLVSLLPMPRRGIGRMGTLEVPKTLRALTRQLVASARARGARFVGDAQTMIARAIVVVGAAGSLPFSASPSVGDVVITGELRHHDALTLLRRGACAIELGHWASERPVLKPLAARIRSLLAHSGKAGPGTADKRIHLGISKADRDPFEPA